MPDFSQRDLAKRVEVLTVLVQSLVVAVDRIEAEVKDLRDKNAHRLTLNGQRRTHQGN